MGVPTQARFALSLQDGLQPQLHLHLLIPVTSSPSVLLVPAAPGWSGSRCPWSSADRARQLLCTASSQTMVCARGHVLSHVHRAVSAGVLAHLFPTLSGLSGAGPSPCRQPALWPEITSTNLPGRVAWLCFYADQPCASHFKAFHRKRRFLCLAVVGVSGVAWLEPRVVTALGRGITACWPPFPSHLRATSPQHNHTRAHTVGVIHSVPRLL